MTLPRAVKPLFDFALHVMIGALSFAMVLMVAAALSLLVRAIEQLGTVSPAIVASAHWVEPVLFYADLALFGLFLLSESIKLVRSLWVGRNHNG